MDKNKLEDWLKKKRTRRDQLGVDQLFEGIVDGSIGLLSQAITLIESKNSEHRLKASSLIQKCLPLSGKSIRIGITGVPGVGKSTFIEAFGKFLEEQGKRVAVLAVDPSSGVSGGSILGDKTRMQELSMRKNVFIRPSAAGDTLGGVARKTRETIILCEAAGFDVILIETVGVGQSETVVKSMVDFFLLLMLSGAGDELQGIKKGIMEMADALVITKADGDNVQKAKLARREYANALHLFPANKNEWIPKTAICSALTGENVPMVWEMIESFENQVKVNGWFVRNRNEQEEKWLLEMLKEQILTDFFSKPGLKEDLQQSKKQVENGELNSFSEADKLFKKYR